MTHSPVRRLSVLAFVVALTGLWNTPLSAQTTRVTTISYAATADGTGVGLSAASDPTADPEIEVGGGVSHGQIDSTPEASGSGQVIVGDDDTLAESSAPSGDGSDSAAGGEIPATSIGPLTVGLEAGQASSESDIAGGDPVTTNEATFGLLIADLEQDLGTPQVPDPLGVSVSVAGQATTADAEATSDTDVASTATASGVLIKIEVDALPAAIVTQICTAYDALGLPIDCPLESLGTGDQELATITLSEGSATCSWNGKSPKASGVAPTFTIQIDGLPPIDIPEGQSMFLPGTEGTPLESEFSAGAYEENENPAADGETDEVTAQAAGAHLSLFEERIVIDFATAECGVSGKIVTEETIARTGGPVVPLLVGGSLLAVLGLGIRRFLKRA